jgi:hypothetical protein
MAKSIILTQNQSANQNKDSSKNLLKSGKIPTKTQTEIFPKIAKKKKSSNIDSKGKIFEAEKDAQRE